MVDQFIMRFWGDKGVTTEITASPVAYAGGGGGGVYAGTPGSGGTGGGGNSGNPGTNGTSNTGGGAGGGSNVSAKENGGTGGSGVVILRYTSSSTITNPGSGLTFSTATDGSDKVTTFTAGTGNIQFN